MGNVAEVKQARRQSQPAGSMLASLSLFFPLLNLLSVSETFCSLYFLFSVVGVHLLCKCVLEVAQTCLVLLSFSLC